MYLKQLELVGFKSFPNKTVIKFSQGKTSIVGPNGCGKTNILDAIRWVMGEQKTSLLRGSSMQEVIFNGSRDMAPLGMAEVSLTMINNRGVLPVEYSEVQITRRLFRSGEAEYLLNKVPCRLKDITELFFDTGAGAHSYSVIQQEMIDSIISDKAEERRFLFEEAAGITKYKQRKNAALRKLDATDQDLQRLRDIYSEVKTQVNSLKRQQRKAERYQILSDEVRNWELFFTSKRVKKIETEKRLLKERFDELSGNLTANEVGVDSLGAEVESKREIQLEIEKELSRVTNELFETTETAHKYEKEISVLTEKKSNATNLIKRNENEIEALKLRSQTLSEQAVDTGAEINEHRAEYEAVDNNLKEAQNRQALVDKQLLDMRSSKDGENSKLIELESRLSSGKTEDDNIQTQIEDLTIHLEELNKSKIELSEKKNELAANLEKLGTLTDELSQSRISAQTELSKTTQEQATKKNVLEQTGKEISKSYASIEASQAQQKILSELIYSFGGTHAGVITVLKLRDEFKGIQGTVADRFKPAAGMEKAVESALGDISHYVICDSKDTAEKIIERLRIENKGRVGLIVPNAGSLNPQIKRPELSSSGFVGWLDEFVSTAENLKPLMQTVLSQTAVFEAGSDPKSILEHLPYGFKAVSTDGLLYTRNTIVGGSAEALQLFRRKDQLTELSQQIDELKLVAETQKQTEHNLAKQISDAEQSINSLNGKLETNEREIASNQKQIDELNYELRLSETELSRLTKEIDLASEKQTQLQQKQYSLNLGYGQLSEQKQSLVNELNLSSKKLEEIERLSGESQSLVSKLQVKAVETQSKIDQCDNKINYTKELLDEISSTIVTKSAEIEDAQEEVEISVKRSAELETKLKLTFESRTEISESQSTLRQKFDELQGQTFSSEKRLKELRLVKDKLSKESHTIEIQMSTLENELKGSTERMLEDYNVNIREFESQNPIPEMPASEAIAHLTRQKELLKNFGAVNLLALEEYQSTSNRKEFLEKQLTDLETARDDLLATITKINKTARTLFEETFEKVKDNFQMLFTELFEGGEASIYLENPNDSLESNIEITARPRGKKLIAITMMSGGERALTAIALLFALYLVKPSAYCILDEIDAPLDDANCRRFLKLIARFADNTQFIIITHNKITMEAADNLYGVTMSSPGVSQIVAVKFSQVNSETGEVMLETPADIIETDEAAEKTTRAETDDLIPQPVVDRISPKIESPVKNREDN